MTSGPGFMPALRADLVDAARRQAAHGRALGRPRRRLVLVAAAVMAAVLVAGTVVEFQTASPAAAGVDVTVAAGQVTVRLTDLEHRPGVIEAAVRKAGLDVHVVAVPAGPSRVGQFLTNVDIGGSPPELRRLDDNGSSFAGFVLPQGWPGRLDLNVGRPAKKGESYLAFSDAYAKGEPLHCSGIYGLTAAQAVRTLPKGVTSVQFWAWPTASAPVQLPAAAVSSSPYSTFLVSDAVAVSPVNITITITPDGHPVQNPPASPSRGACTP